MAGIRFRTSSVLSSFLSVSDMNTPKTPKRFTYKPPKDSPDGSYNKSLDNPEIALVLANVMVRFEHLEDEFAIILSILSGVDPVTAKIMLRSIKAPKARQELVKSLLEHSRHNIDADPIFDEIISEFSAIATKRNKYVHGRWLTHRETGKTYFAKPSPEGWDVGEYEEFNIETLEQILDMITRTTHLCWNAPFPPEMRRPIPALQKPRAQPSSNHERDTIKPQQHSISFLL